MIWNCISRLVVVLTIAITFFSTLIPPAMAQIDRPADQPGDQAAEIAVQAYIYAYPALLMEVTRQKTTKDTARIAQCPPMNQFLHVRTFPNPAFQLTSYSNVDTLYSSAWLDVSQEPIVLSVPDTNRYYMMQILDMWTDSVASPGTRTTGNEAGNFAFVGPDWEGNLPSDLRPIPIPTNQSFIIGRTLTNGVLDYKNVWAIQNQYTLTPLSQWPAVVQPLGVLREETCDINIEPDVVVNAMDAETYFTLFAEVLKHNPPHRMDWNLVQQLSEIGIVVGEDFNFAALDPDIQAKLESAVDQGQALIFSETSATKSNYNGWEISREFIGTYGTSYLRRANLGGLHGLGYNVPEDAIYPLSASDAEGTPYDGNNNYVLHFDDGSLPVNGFWSLTMYDSSGLFVDNAIKRYAIGDRNSLNYNSDGSLDLYIQHSYPGKLKQSNWLPAPTSEFQLMLRLYSPKLEVLTGAWNPPPVTLVTAP